MLDEERINAGHENTRNLLRVLGPITFALGGLLMLIGLASFFTAFGTFSRPRYFWCCFAAMPLLAAGGAMSKFGFMGAITRYQAGEMAPVGKDTFNYLADGTRQGVQTIANAFNAERQGRHGVKPVSCPRCSQINEQDAKFCTDCGSALSKVCSGCGKVNDGAAKFCQDCGRSLIA